MKRNISLLSFFFLLSILACKKETDGPDLQRGMISNFNLDNGIEDSINLDHEMLILQTINGSKDRHGGFGAIFFDGGLFRFKMKEAWNMFPLTTSVWIKPKDLAQDNIFLYALGAKMLLWQTFNDLHLIAVGCDVSTPIVDGWTHVAVTYDGKLMKLYVNGEHKAGFTYEQTGTFTAWMVGGVDYISPVWKGAMDDLRFYDRVLTDKEIELLAK